MLISTEDTMITYDMKVSGLNVTIREAYRDAQVAALSKIIDDFWSMLDYDPIVIHWPVMK